MKISFHLQGGPRQEELVEPAAGRLRVGYQEELPDCEKSKVLCLRGSESPCIVSF